MHMKQAEDLADLIVNNEVDINMVIIERISDENEKKRIFLNTIKIQT